MRLDKVYLRGESVELVPMDESCTGILAEIGLYEELWKWQPVHVSSYDEMEKYVLRAMNEYEDGKSLPFLIKSRKDGQIVGTTRYLDIALAHKRLEVGATWLTPNMQRTGINTEAKYLLLEYVFEKLGMMKVVLKTEFGNSQSRTAIARIGAKQEGIFLKHFIAESGRVRDMVYFGITDEDWPNVKILLRNKMKKSYLSQ